MFRIKDDKGSMNIEKIARTMATLPIQSARTKARFKFDQKPKLFSLLDINDHITNNRGTSLPSQFKRLSNQELIALFGEEFAKENKLLKLTIDTSHSKNDCGRNETEPKNYMRYAQTESNFHKFAYSKNDKWKPKSFKRYEYLLHNPKLIGIEGLNNKFANKLPNYTLKEIRDKNYNSDVFFIKKKKNCKLNDINTEHKEDVTHDDISNVSDIHINNNNNKRFHTEINEDNNNSYITKKAPYGDPRESDIFFLKNNKTTQQKSGEVYLYKPQKLESYTTSKESKSEWAAKTSLPSLLNHTSSNWHPLNASNKNISYTKEQILTENNKEGINPIYRQKSISEFIDLTRVGAPNPNRTYLESFNKTHGCFRKRTDLGGAYNDIHKMYKDICDRPFIRPKYD